MSEWISSSDKDESTWWPANKRILTCDEHGWMLIMSCTENGFELDDGSEPGCCPIYWQPLPEPPNE